MVSGGVIKIIYGNMIVSVNNSIMTLGDILENKLLEYKICEFK